MYPEPVDLLQQPLPRPRGPGTGWFELEDWVGPGRPSRRADVAKIEAILAGSGDYSLARTQGPTGWWGLALDEGIRAYQRRNGLAVDGALRPDGPTIRHMRDAFAHRLGRWQPPAPEDIDAHHAAIDAGGDDVVAWRPAPVALDRIAGLPEIGADADASNARLVRAMGKIGGFGTYPELFARTIGEFGAPGLAEVRDLVGKYEAEHPGQGGHLAAEIVGRVPPETLKELGVEVPDGPPPGVKVAAGPAALLPLLPWAAGALGLGAAAVHGAKETRKILDQQLPGFTPAPAGNDNRLPPTHVPDPAPPHTGHAPESPDPTANVETFPKLPEEKRNALINEIVEGLFPNYVEAVDRPDLRGSPRTVRGTEIAIQVIKKLFEESDFPEEFEHSHGGSKDGEGQEYRPEATITHDDGSFNRSDGAFRRKNAEDGDPEFHFNTMTLKTDGTPIRREQIALDRIKRHLKNGVMAGLPKLAEGVDEEEFRARLTSEAEAPFRKFLDIARRILRRGAKP